MIHDKENYRELRRIKSLAILSIWQFSNDFKLSQAEISQIQIDINVFGETLNLKKVIQSIKKRTMVQSSLFF